MNRFLVPKIISSLCFWNYKEENVLSVPKNLRVAILGNYASNIRPESSKASNLSGTLSTDRDRYNIVTVSKLIHYTHSVVFLNMIEFYDYIYFTIA